MSASSARSAGDARGRPLLHVGQRQGELLAACLPVAASAPEQPGSGGARPARRRRPRPAPRPLAAPALRVRRPKQVMSATPLPSALRRVARRRPGTGLKAPGDAAVKGPGRAADASPRRVAGCLGLSFHVNSLKLSPQFKDGRAWEGR